MLLDYEQTLKLQYDKHQLVFEDEPVPDSSIEDIDHEVVDRFKRTLGTTVSDKQTLRSARFLTKDGLLTKAGVLLFAEHPTIFLPQARVRVLRFEGLVNAVTHRDYSYAGEHIRISMYDDRLEILSPGKLPNTVTLENMRTTRYARNPRIAKTLVAFG